MTTIDHPLTRNHRHCPLCDKVKKQGLVVCWDCYHEHGLRYGNEEAEVIIDKHEAMLKGNGHEKENLFQSIRPGR